MSIRLGYQVHCDRSDCNRHAEFVCEPDDLWGTDAPCRVDRGPPSALLRQSRDTTKNRWPPLSGMDGHHPCWHAPVKGTQQKGSR